MRALTTPNQYPLIPNITIFLEALLARCLGVEKIIKTAYFFTATPKLLLLGWDSIEDAK